MFGNAVFNFIWKHGELVSKRGTITPRNKVYIEGNIQRNFYFANVFVELFIPERTEVTLVFYRDLFILKIYYINSW